MQNTQCLGLEGRNKIINDILHVLPASTNKLCNIFDLTREDVLRILDNNLYILPPHYLDTPNEMSLWVASDFGQAVLDEEKRILDFKLSPPEYLIGFEHENKLRKDPVYRLLNSDPYLTKIKTDVSADDVRAGMSRWGSLERYREELVKTENTLAKCGNEHIFFTCSDIECKGSHELHEMLYDCMNPYCPKCPEKIKYHKSRFLEALIKTYPKPRIFEIGWKGHHALTIENLRGFRKDFNKLIARLRKLKMINKHFSVVELAHHKDGFNFHVHVVFQGRFIDQNLISKTWLKVTGHSFIADIRLVRETNGALADISKYLCKPFSGIPLARWVAVLKHNRLFSMSRNNLTMKEHKLRELEKAMSGTDEQDPLNLLQGSANRALCCQYCGQKLVPIGVMHKKYDKTMGSDPPSACRQGS